MICFLDFAAFNHFNILSHSRATSTSSGVSSCPPLKNRIVTSAPASRKSSESCFVSDAGTIGSIDPAPIHTRTEEGLVESQALAVPSLEKELQQEIFPAEVKASSRRCWRH